MRPERRLILLLILLATSLSLGACASKRGRNINITITDDASERMNEARTIAGQAQAEEDPIEAINLYQQAVTTYSDLPAAWNNLGVLLMEEEQYIQAAEAFAEAAQRAPTDPRPAYNLGLTWERAAYVSDALVHYANALEKDPRYLPALRGAVRAEALQGTFSDVTAERIRIALMLEQDEAWRQFFERQKSRVENELRIQRGTRSARDDG
jgi:tetratricopeptide (TPR) repeat protein